MNEQSTNQATKESCISGVIFGSTYFSVWPMIGMETSVDAYLFGCVVLIPILYALSLWEKS